VEYNKTETKIFEMIFSTEAENPSNHDDQAPCKTEKVSGILTEPYQ
jgi:hypothetical protein